MIDHEQQIRLLEDFVKDSSEVKRWQVFIKLDVGSRRAGISTDSLALKSLIERAENSHAVSIYGVYCHAGHSYNCRNRESVESVLQSELDGVLHASRMITTYEGPLVLSIGSTPTAHAIRFMKNRLPPNSTLELHAGGGFLDILGSSIFLELIILLSRKFPRQ